VFSKSGNLNPLMDVLLPKLVRDPVLSSMH
jgi:hypothetical protein